MTLAIEMILPHTYYSGHCLLRMPFTYDFTICKLNNFLTFVQLKSKRTAYKFDVIYFCLEKYIFVAFWQQELHSIVSGLIN